MASGSGPSTGCCCRRCWADWVPTASAVPASLPLHRRASRQGQRWLRPARGSAVRPRVRACASSTPLPPPPASVVWGVRSPLMGLTRRPHHRGHHRHIHPHPGHRRHRRPCRQWAGPSLIGHSHPRLMAGLSRTTPDLGQRCILGLWTVSCGPTSHVHVQPGRCTHEMNDCHERDQRPDRGRSTEVLVHCWLVLTSVLLLKFLTRSGPAPSCGALSLVLHDPRDLRSVSSRVAVGREIARGRNGELVSTQRGRPAFGSGFHTHLR